MSRNIVALLAIVVIGGAVYTFNLFGDSTSSEIEATAVPERAVRDMCDTGQVCEPLKSGQECPAEYKVRRYQSLSLALNSHNEPQVCEYALSNSTAKSKGLCYSCN